MQPLLLRHFGFEAAPLLGRIGQLAEPVREFHTAGVKLEPLGNAWVMGGRPRQRGLGDRIFIKYGRPADAEIWFDPLDQHPAEHIRPGIVGSDPYPRFCRRRGERVAIGIVRRHRREQIDLGKAREGLRHGHSLRFGKWRRDAIAEGKPPRAGGVRGGSDQRRTILHDCFVGFLRAIPFKQRELGVMQRAALAVAEHPGEVENLPFACGEQLLAAKFRRRVQIKARGCAVRCVKLGRERMQVRLVAGRNLQHRALHFGEAARAEEIARGGGDAPACGEERAPVRMHVRRPPGRWCAHAPSPRLHTPTTKPLANRFRIAMLRADIAAALPAGPRHQGSRSVKVIASSLRKGNVVDMDGKLYVILSAENIHPGKGTPVTQLDMRRISDGVKVSERYRTTEQVERAYVEDRDYQYLYQDGDGFHFMNPETYDQIAVSKDIVGDQAAYLQENMKVTLSTHEGVVLTVELPQRATLEVVETEPTVKGQTASSSYKPALLSNGVRTMVPPHIAPGTRIVVMTADGSYVERAKD